MQAAKASPALELTLELVRAEEAGDHYYPVRPGERTYLRRLHNGDYEDAALVWGEEMVAVLARLARPSPDGDAARRLGAELRAFLDAASFGEEEARIKSAVAEGRRVNLTI